MRSECWSRSWDWSIGCILVCGQCRSLSSWRDESLRATVYGRDELNAPCHWAAEIDRKWNSSGMNGKPVPMLRSTAFRFMRQPQYSAIPWRLPSQTLTIRKVKSDPLRLGCRNRTGYLWSRIRFGVPKHGSSARV